jgi:HlyD family secretion protein
MNTEVEIEVAQRDDATVIPNDAVVSMRDATVAGKALGLSEDVMREKMQALRGGMRGGAPTNAPGTQVAAAQGQQQQSAGAAERGNEGAAQRGNAGARTRGGNSGFAGGMAGGQRRGPGTSRPGIVFVPGSNGPEPRIVMLGVNDWDYTEVLSGLEEGDKVFMMTAARLAQQERERADRMRQRSGSMGGMRNTQQQQQGGGNPSGGR